jgi:hypothetical protein
VTNEAVNSAGTGGGSALKYAVKLPNLLTVRDAAGSFDLTPKISRNEVHGEIEVVDALTVLLELSSKVSILLSN